MTKLSTLPRVVLLITVVAICFLLLASAVSAEIGEASTSTYLIRSGDTLWSVASEVAAPGEDLRRVVFEIRRLNGLEGSLVVPGQEIEVPAR